MPTNDAINKAIESLRPEAKELIDSLNAKPVKTTKDNYGEVMAFLSGLKSKQMGMILLAAMIREGYPKDTADQLVTLMGW